MLRIDMARVDSLRGIARDIASASGKKIRLLLFEGRKELEVIEP